MRTRFVTRLDDNDCLTAFQPVDIKELFLSLESLNPSLQCFVYMIPQPHQTFMSTSHFPETQTSMRLDTSQGVTTPFTVPPDQMQRWVRPSRHPMPGLPYPPVAFTHNSTFHPSSLAPGSCGVAGASHVPEYSYNTVQPTASFLPPSERTNPLMVAAGFPASSHPYYNMPGQAATAAAPVPSSEVYHNQQLVQLPTQLPPPQPEVVPVQDQYHQNATQDVQQAFPVGGLPQEFGEADHTQSRSYPFIFGSEVRPYRNQ